MRSVWEMRCTLCGDYVDDDGEAPLCEWCEERVYGGDAMTNAMKMHEAVSALVDAETKLSRMLDELGPAIPYASACEDLFNALCSVVCLDAESSGQLDLMAALGCDQVCDGDLSFYEPPTDFDATDYGPFNMPDPAIAGYESSGGERWCVSCVQALELRDPQPHAFVAASVLLDVQDIAWAPVEQRQDGATEFQCDHCAEDDDPSCAYCGTYKSEHSRMGCEGFMTRDDLKAFREQIEREVNDPDNF